MGLANSCALAGAGLALVLAVSTASAQEAVRVRGTIEQGGGTSYVVKDRKLGLIRLVLSPNVSVAVGVKSALSDIKPGSFIGVAGMPQPDGSQRALEAHIFHESMRGTGEGHRPWDLLPQSTMTNAIVEGIAATPNGQSLTLKYKDGEKRIVVPSGTVIVTYLPGVLSDLKAGAAIFVPAATKARDGTFKASRIMVGRDISPPQ